MITRFIVDIYHVRWHRGLKDTPIRRYNESVARHGMKPLPDPKKLAVTLSLVYFRRPQRYGIQFEDLLYDSPQLAIYRTLKGVPQIVTVKVDPNDLTRIWYLDETVGDYVELRVQKSMRNQLQGVTLSLHKMARALQRSNPEVLAGEAGMSKAYAMIRRSLEERVRGRDGLTNRRRAMRALAKLRKKAEAMYEDAPAVETAADEGDLTDELFGPECAEPDYNTSEAILAAPEAAAVQQEPVDVPALPPAVREEQKPAKPRRQRARSGSTSKIQNELPTPPESPPSSSKPPGDDDDLDDITADVRGNLFRNNQGRETGDV